MTASPVDTTTSDDRLRRAVRHPDVIVILVWLASSAVLSIFRKEFTGDGVRHLGPILRADHPQLGEPRWLLFPGFLFAVLRPVVAAGLASSVEGLTRPMMAATLAAAAVYMFSVRACLSAIGVPAAKRALSLAAAGVSAGLFFAATDLMEPIFAAAIALGGLAFAAKRQSLAQASWEERVNGAIVSVAATAVASLLYQGVILAVGLLPLFVPLKVLTSRRTVIASLVILAAVPMVTTGALMLSGNTATHALSRFSKGEENPFYRSYLKKPGLGPYVVAFFGGPPQGILAIPEFRGFNALFSGLRDAGSRADSLWILVRIAIASLILWAVVLTSVRRRDVGTLIALAVLVSLPVVRHQQYGYLKYYILLPVILAAVATQAPLRWLIPSITIVALINGSTLISKIRADRRLYAARILVYDAAGADDCWVTTGWGPAVSFRWPGTVCGVLGRLAGGSGNDVRQVIADSHADLTSCLKMCFCKSPSVYTDDMLETGNQALDGAAVQFNYTDVDLRRVTVPAVGAIRVSSPETEVPAVYKYSSAEQHRICLLMNVAH